MRQRFLLVAGWVIAATATSLVATGAVAVAGGQVTDRPLRPLTAAEVAALPVAKEEVPVRASPLPPAAPTREPGTASEGVATERPADGSTPAGDEGTLLRGGPANGISDAPAGPPLDAEERAPSYADDATLPPSEGPVGASAVEHLIGGSVSIAARDDRLILLWARPRPGFVATVDFPADTNLSVVFSAARHRSFLIARWAAGELEIQTLEELR